MDAAKERRRMEAKQRIQEILHGKSASTSATTPKEQPKPLIAPATPVYKPPVRNYRRQPITTTPVYTPVPAAPIIQTTPAYAPPAPSPHPAQQQVHTETVIYTPPPPPLSEPEVPALQPVTAEKTEIALPAPPTSSVWHEVPLETPLPAPSPDEAVAVVAPADTQESTAIMVPKEGVVSDKRFIAVPGSAPIGETKMEPVTAEAIVVPIPDGAESEDGTNVALLPEVAAAMAAVDPALLPPRENLSPETEAILDDLPEEIIGRSRKDMINEFNLNRVDPDIALPQDALGASEDLTSDMTGLNVAVRKRTIDVDYELEKAYIALVGGNPEEAIAIYKMVLENDSDSIPALFGLATTYHRVGLLDEARPIYGKLLKRDPKHKDAINNFLVLVGEEAPARALEHMKFLERENPDFAPLPAQMALLYSRLGDMPNAIKSMQRAVNISPENLVYKYNLAILYDKANKPVEAGILYRQLLEARYRGEKIPADADQIQQRLTFLLSNT